MYKPHVASSDPSPLFTAIFFHRVDGVEEVQYELSRIKQKSKAAYF